MTRGIQLKQLNEMDLGHLGLPAELLGGSDRGFDIDALDAALSALSAAEPRIDETLPDPRSIAREVRVCLEETLVLLTEALPAGYR